MSQRHDGEAYQKQIGKLFIADKGRDGVGVLYIPGLTRAFGSLAIGVMLSQLLYWHGRGIRSDGWIWKTVDELEAETGLSYCQQKTAIDICRKHGFLESRKMGIPGRRHLRLDLDKLKEILISFSKTEELAGIFGPDRIFELTNTNTETTHETTPQTSASTTPLKDNGFVENRRTGVEENDELERGLPNDW